MEFTLLAAAALGVGAMMGTLQFVRARLAPEGVVKALNDPLFSAVGIGILIGRLSAMVASGTNPFTHLGDILIVRGGVATGAASVAAIGAWAFSVRNDIRRSSDLAAPAILIGLAGWHGGCLFRDACAGTVSSLPWSITLPGSVVGRHPVELYAAGSLLVAAAVIHKLPLGTGAVFGWGLAAAGSIRLMTEPIRASLGGGPTFWYLSALVAGLTIVVASRLIQRDTYQLES